MPIYEYECPTHGVWELFCTHTDPKDTEPCWTCSEISVLCWSMVSMQPDSGWHTGYQVNGIPLSSQAEYRKMMDRCLPDTEANRQIVKNQRYTKRREAEQKKSAKLEKYLGEQLSGVTIDPDYNHLPKTGTKRRDKQNKFD